MVEAIDECSEAFERPLRTARLAHRARSTSSRAAPNRTLRLKLAIALFVLHVVGTPLLFGGVFPWAMLVTAASSLLCMALAISADTRATPANAVLWSAAGLLVWTGLQALPLPCGLVEVVARSAADTLRTAQAALGGPRPQLCTLSHDPGATREEIVKGIAIVTTLFTASVLTLRGARREVLWAAAASSLSMSLIALAHAVLQLDQVYGVYQPVQVKRLLLLAPLMNPNNLGGFAAVGVPLWIGLTHRHHEREVRWLGRVAMVICAAVAVLTLSRAAIAQTICGFLLMLWFTRIAVRRSRRRSSNAQRKSPRMRWLDSAGVAITGAAALSCVLYIAGERVASEVENRDLSKLTVLGRAFEFAGQHAWTGVGRGAFSSTYVAFYGDSVRFAYAENFVAQWISEWGLPMTLVWLTMVTMALARALPKLTSLAMIGGAVGFLALCAQNLVDLGFEILGVATLAATLLGVLVTPDKPPPPTSFLRSVGGYFATVLIIGVVGLALLGPKLSDHSVPALDDRLRNELAESRRADFRTTLELALALHPSEPVFAVVAATEALMHQDPSTGRWLNRAMQVAPLWGAPHLLAFQWLWLHGQRSQALLEFKRTAEADIHYELIGQHLCMLAGLNGEYILAAAPDGPHRRPFLETAASCIRPDYRSADVIDRALLKEFPESPVAHERTAIRLSIAGEVDEALAIFASLLERDPRNDSARIQRADVLLRAGRLRQAVAQVDQDLGMVAEHSRATLLSQQAHAFASLGDADGVQRSVLAYRRSTADTADGLAGSYALQGQLDVQLGRPGAALGAFREAYRINKNPDALLNIAALAQQLGDRAQELWAYVKLCELDLQGASHCAIRDRLAKAQQF
jgi:tetratricopeptide (TPR) repeat protein